MENSKWKRKRRGAGMNLLCDDLQEEILFRLSCQALYRAKCVSKGCNDLISSAISHGRGQPSRTPAVFVYAGRDEKLRNKWGSGLRNPPVNIAPPATDPSTPWFYLNGVVCKLPRSRYNSDKALCHHISSINLPKEDHMWISGRCAMKSMDGCLAVTAYVRNVKGTELCENT
ncbi:hypothetical protein H6P81_014209 [Aristolochia fimbriata]|uniref:F-box domain-containing protein n=1 Tax=Aristolochia fimbriata TaxID=158543 RepID=A0AAV7EK64_ARIFI|nr:hypothetical protein H6P81_014209 [Aristolochia fimbriata]